MRTGDYIPRLGGTFLTHKDFLKEKRDAVKRFTRGMIKATDYIKANKKGTIEVIEKYFEIKDAKKLREYLQSGLRQVQPRNATQSD